MSLTVTDLAHHIVTLRRLYERVLEADIELLRRAYGESLVEEALRLADEPARQALEEAWVDGLSCRAARHPVRLNSAEWRRAVCVGWWTVGGTAESIRHSGLTMTLRRWG